MTRISRTILLSKDVHRKISMLIGYATFVTNCREVSLGEAGVRVRVRLGSVFKEHDRPKDKTVQLSNGPASMAYSSLCVENAVPHSDG